MKNTQAKDIDEYIAGFPADVRKKLGEMRATIRKAAPDAEEVISYAVPTYRFHGNLVHFAAFKSHIGFYPAPSGIEAFKKELSAYHGGKGTVQFPLDAPLPLALISRIVRFRLRENLDKMESKKAKARRARAS